jgi:hypothetical protein
MTALLGTPARTVLTMVMAFTPLTRPVLAQTAQNATQTSTTPTFDLDLKVPEDPAFTILGVSPTNVERPTIPSALGMSLLSSTSSSTNFIPNNYALQVAPYWLGRPSVEFLDYLYPSVHQSLAQTLSLSFATAKSGGTGAPESATDISGGVRTSIRAGRASTAFMNSLASLLAVSSEDAAMAGVLNEVSRLAKPDVQSKDPARPKTLWPDATAPADQWANAIQANLGVMYQPGSTVRGRAEAFFRLPSQQNLLAWLNGRFEERFDGTGPGPAMQKRINAIATLSEAYIKARVGDPKQKGARQKGSDVIATAVDELYLSDDVAALVLLSVGQSPGPTPAALNAVAVRLLRAFVPLLQVAKTSVEAEQKGIITAAQAADSVRRGYLVTVSGAIGSRVPNDGFSDARLLRWGVWSTHAYRTDGTQLELLGVVKLIHRPATEGANLLDVGGRIVKQAGQAAVSGEYLQRVTLGDSSAPTAQRVTVNFDYKIAAKAYVTAAFGKDFADPTKPLSKGGLVSIVGLNLGFASKATIAMPAQ